MSLSNGITETSGIQMNAQLMIQRKTLENQESAAEEARESATTEAKESQRQSDGIRGKLLDVIG